MPSRSRFPKYSYTYPTRTSQSVSLTLFICLFSPRNLHSATQPGSPPLQHYAYLMMDWDRLEVMFYTPRSPSGRTTETVRGEVYNGIWPSQYLPLVDVSNNQDFESELQRLKAIITGTPSRPRPGQTCACPDWAHSVGWQLREGGMITKGQLEELEQWFENLYEGECEICGSDQPRIRRMLERYGRAISPSTDNARSRQQNPSFSSMGRTTGSTQSSVPGTPFSPASRAGTAQDWRVNGGVTYPIGPAWGGRHAY